MISNKTRKRSCLITLGILVVAFLLGFFATASYGKDVWLVELRGAIGPASSDFTTSTLSDAADAGVELIVLRINTPGGLDLAMRDIISGILSSPVPVATWVAPNGSRAASAGTYILYASHIAAMAPATNVGSSTPVSIGGGSSPALPAAPQDGGDENGENATAGSSAMEKKIINDAVAYIKSLAELRDRNSEWAVQTVTKAANLTASEALDLNVIDIIAESIDDLLGQIHGKTLLLNDREVTLDVNESSVIIVEPDWRHEFLALITDPNVAYIFLMIGLYGIIFEFYNPGLGIPGIVGVICLLIGAYALQMLPINYVGLALIIVGIALMVAEALSPSFGVFGIGGAIAFVLGSVIFMFGRFYKVKGPGLILVIPFLQQIVKVGLRIKVGDIPTQDLITRDNVSVKVNAVLYFRVVDPEKAIVNVEDYMEATSQLAQTTLRSVLGQHDLDELLAERDKLNVDVQKILDEQTDNWGIKVSNVEIKHVDIDESMIRAIAKQAEAERVRRAKVIHAKGESEAAENLVEAAKQLATQPQSMQLRYLQTLTEIAGEKNSTIVFPLPVDMLEAFKDMLGRKQQSVAH
jgi:membrane-bound serine protease (ClpP class)